MSLHAELCRLFNASRFGMDCLLNNGQVTIDGFIIRHKHLERWNRQQLQGRMARLSSAGKVFREAKLYGR